MISWGDILGHHDCIDKEGGANPLRRAGLSGANLENGGVPSGIPRLIYRKNLKPGFPRPGRGKSPAGKLALRSGIFQGEFPGNLSPIGPLSPYLDFV